MVRHFILTTATESKAESWNWNEHDNQNGRSVQDLASEPFQASAASSISGSFFPKLPKRRVREHKGFGRGSRGLFSSYWYQPIASRSISGSFPKHPQHPTGPLYPLAGFQVPKNRLQTRKVRDVGSGSEDLGMRRRARMRWWFIWESGLESRA